MASIEPDERVVWAETGGVTVPEHSEGCWSILALGGGVASPRGQ